mmetsp:Transcript_88832/g.162534  ORF Transcript_88832/g.162534 Transcript_88832/m.162534 type:complete len:94 (-) Transcript_88832:788-1069(-)
MDKDSWDAVAKLPGQAVRQCVTIHNDDRRVAGLLCIHCKVLPEPIHSKHVSECFAVGLVLTKDSDNASIQKVWSRPGRKKHTRSSAAAAANVI